MNNSLPKWFNIWWVINVCIAIAFIIYWYSIDFESNKLVYVFILYSNLWGLWAAKFRRNIKDKLIK